MDKMGRTHTRCCKVRKSKNSRQRAALNFCHPATDSNFAPPHPHTPALQSCESAIAGSVTKALVPKHTMVLSYTFKHLFKMQIHHRAVAAPSSESPGLRGASEQPLCPMTSTVLGDK